MSYPKKEKKRKEKKNPRSISRPPRVTMRGIINHSTRVSKVTLKGRLYA